MLETATRARTRDPRAVREAYAHCARVAHRSGSSFLAAFWLFPPAQRRALHAIYAFCRLADDIADDPDVRGDRAVLLARWRELLDAAFRGEATHPVGVALGDAARRFPLEKAWLRDLLDGVAQDLRGDPMERFEDLERYCYCVASTVGLLVVAVRGLRGPEVASYATHMGVAVQLTNILRDVGEDAAAGRIYLAQEDLARHGVEPASLRRAEASEPLRLLLAVYAERARIRYERAQAALPGAHRAALRPAQAMGAIYRDLLETLQARGFPCRQALRQSKPRRLAIAARTWALA